MKTSTFRSAITVGVLIASSAFAHAAQPGIRLGVAAPMSGPSANAGLQIEQGVRQAVHDVNAAGGVLGRKIDVEIGDDVSKPEQGVAVANTFIRDGVKFVVGDYNSAVSIPASDIYRDHGVLQITPASTNPTFTERGLWNVFRVCSRSDQQGEVAAAYILRHFAGKKIAIVEDETTYGKHLAEEVRKALNANGVHEVLYGGLNVGAQDYSAIVGQIKEVGADLVYFGGLAAEGGRLLRQMRERGVEALLMGGDGLASEQLAATGGPNVAGTLMTFGPDLMERRQAAAVVKEFEAKKFTPEAYTLYSYAAVQIIEQAAEKAKSLDPQKVAAEMHSGVPFKTVIGDIAFDAKGDRTKPDYVVYVWTMAPDGKLTFVEAQNK